MAAATAQEDLEATVGSEMGEMAAAAAQEDLEAAVGAEMAAESVRADQHLKVEVEVVVEPMMQLTRKQRQNLRRKRSFKTKNIQARQTIAAICWKGVQGDSKSEAA